MLRILAALIAIFAAGNAQAQMPAHDEGKTVLHVSESAQRSLKQDRLTVQMRAEVMGPDAGKVQGEINRKMTAALEKARTVPSVHTDARGYWVQQEQPQNQPMRWRGVQTLGMTGPDSGALLNLAGELQQAGLILSGLNYDLAPETARSAEDELTAEALKRLRERTERVASAMGLQLERYRDLRVGNVNGNRPVMPMMRMGAASTAAAQMPPPAAEPGESVVQVTVDADAVLVPRTRP
jgi:uncharacterized protein